MYTKKKVLITMSRLASLIGLIPFSLYWINADRLAVRTCIFWNTNGVLLCNSCNTYKTLT